MVIFSEYIFSALIRAGWSVPLQSLVNRATSLLKKELVQDGAEQGSTRHDGSLQCALVVSCCGTGGLRHSHARHSKGPCKA